MQTIDPLQFEIFFLGQDNFKKFKLQAKKRISFFCFCCVTSYVEDQSKQKLAIYLAFPTCQSNFAVYHSQNRVYMLPVGCGGNLGAEEFPLRGHLVVSQKPSELMATVVEWSPE